MPLSDGYHWTCSTKLSSSDMRMLSIIKSHWPTVRRSHGKPFRTAVCTDSRTWRSDSVLPSSAAVETILEAAGVMTKRYFFPVHRMEVYRPLVKRALPLTDALHDRLLCIPLYHDLPAQRIETIAQLIRATVRGTATRIHAA